MNCLDFHRQKLSDPRRLSEDARAHARNCSSCADFARSVDRADAQIEDALLVSVPEGLADRIILRRKGIERPAWQVWALAASVALGIGVAASYLGFRTPDQYAGHAIEHVLHEPESFARVQQPEPGSITAALRSVGGSLREPFGRLRYVRLCPLEEGGTGWHLVFDTPHGLATLILVPDRQIRGQSQSTVDGWTAVVQPAPRGYYAVVASSAVTSNRVAALMKTHVDWKS